MADFEYKVVVAPRKPRKLRGVKGTQDRFALTLEEVLNEECTDGWNYFRSDTLLAEERRGFFRSASESYQSVLIFRREKASRANYATNAVRSRSEPAAETYREPEYDRARHDSGRREAPEYAGRDDRGTRRASEEVREPVYHGRAERESFRDDRTVVRRPYDDLERERAAFRDSRADEYDAEVHGDVPPIGPAARD